MPQLSDRSLGVILYYRFPRSIKFLILKHKKGHWSFPKGHKDDGETDFMTAKRELKEETGIRKVKYISKRPMLRETYLYRNKKDIKVKKKVIYFIGESSSKEVKIDGMEISNYKWCSLASGEKLITFKESRKLLKNAFKIISNRNFKNNKKSKR